MMRGYARSVVTALNETARSTPSYGLASLYAMKPIECRSCTRSAMPGSRSIRCTA